MLLFSKRVLLEDGSTAYFGTRDLAGITIFAALWGVLNVTISPIFFQVFHLPFWCDLVGFAAIILAVWYVRKIGAATLVGLIATIINFMFRPEAYHFFGFTTASIVFDVLTSFIGHERMFQKRLLGSLSLFAVSVVSAAIAGLIIGAFFLAPAVLQTWGGILSWAGLHAIGGVIGGAVGVSLTNALTARGIAPKAAELANKN